MQRTTRKFGSTAIVAVIGLSLALTIFAGTAWGQTALQDVYQVNYYSAGSGVVRITHPGYTSDPLCAMIYVYAPDQQQTECCGCRLTHNGLRTLSISSNLISNPLTGVREPTGVIKIVSSAPFITTGGTKVCDPRRLAPLPNLRAWATHIQTGGQITEEEFSDSGLSASEQIVCRILALPT
jgi:hypothetical protein